MSVVFDLPHETNNGGWLGYSHADLPPTDRIYYPGAGVLHRKNVRLANWYFLTDDALQIINPSKYTFVPKLDRWLVCIDDPNRATLFRLRFI